MKLKDKVFQKYCDTFLEDNKSPTSFVKFCGMECRSVVGLNIDFKRLIDMTYRKLRKTEEKRSKAKYADGPREMIL